MALFQDVSFARHDGTIGLADNRSGALNLVPRAATTPKMSRSRDCCWDPASALRSRVAAKVAAAQHQGSARDDLVAVCCGGKPERQHGTPAARLLVSRVAPNVL